MSFMWKYYADYDGSRIPYNVLKSTVWIFKNSFFCIMKNKTYNRSTHKWLLGIFKMLNVELKLNNEYTNNKFADWPAVLKQHIMAINLILTKP